MNSKNIERYKKILKLSKQQREILVGLLLGDGHLETQNNGRTFRLKVEHSIKQKQYVDWLYAIWKPWMTKSPEKRTRTYQNKQYYKYYFTTLSHGIFRFYGQQFYKNNIKIVPELIHRWLTPQAFAIWFMDDGSLKSQHHNARLLNTQGFSKKEVLRLAQNIQTIFQLKTSLRKQKEGYQIMIAAESATKLYRILSPYIIPSMRYKLPKIRG